MNPILQNVLNALAVSKLYFLCFEFRQAYKIKTSMAYRAKSVVVFDRFLVGEYSRIHGKKT